LKEDMVSLALSAAEKAVREKLDAPTHRRLISEAIDELARTKST